MKLEHRTALQRAIGTLEALAASYVYQGQFEPRRDVEETICGLRDLYADLSQRATTAHGPENHEGEIPRGTRS